MKQEHIDIPDLSWTKDPRHMEERKNQKTVINREDSRVQQVETKVDSLSEKLSAMNLLLKKSTKKVSGVRKYADKPCSFAEKKDILRLDIRRIHIGIPLEELA